jgi:hypothetical protein
VILLATDVLVKAINDEYSQILASERNNLQKALAIGEKLVALRPRIAPKHGEWQAKLEEYCPKISYETATLYIRLFERQVDWRAAAAAKNVEPTDLTIDAARNLLAKPRATATSESDSHSDSESVTDEGSDDGQEEKEKGESDETEEEVVGKKWLETLAPDDLIFWLKEVHDDEYLKELAAKLAKELTPLPLPPKHPLDIPSALQRTPTAPTVTAPVIRRPV